MSYDSRTTFSGSNNSGSQIGMQANYGANITIFGGSNNNSRASDRETFLDSLRFEQISDRHGTIAEAHKRTFRWIWNQDRPHFVDWLRFGKEIFWISGKAGAGKSTLMKYIFDDPQLREHLSHSGKPVLSAAFFFHDGGTPLQKSFEGLLRSILLQVFEGSPSLLSAVLSHHHKLFSNRIKNPEAREWLLHELQAMLKSLQSLNPSETDLCLLIDGLDEFNGDNQVIARFFVDFARSTSAGALNVKVCISSRPENAFEHHFSRFKRLPIHDMTSADIKTYVADELDIYYDLTSPSHRNDHSEETSDRDELVRQVVFRASGVFLWVHIVVKLLGDGIVDGESFLTLFARLDHIPKNLEHLYRHMLLGIKPSDKQEALLLLSIIQTEQKVSNGVPITLQRLSFAAQGPHTAITSKIGTFDNQARRSLSGRMVKRVRTCCAGFVEVRDCILHNGQSDRSVYLIHRIVEEYMKSEDWNAFFHAYELLEPDPHLSLLCSYLCRLKVVDPKPVSYSQELNNAFFHAKKVKDSSVKHMVALLDELDHAMTQLNRHSYWTWSGEWLMRDVKDRNPVDMHHGGRPFLAVAVCQGLHRYVEEKLRYTTPEPYLLLYAGLVCLDWTSWDPLEGHPEMLALSPKKGADPNAICNDLGKSVWQLVLQWMEAHDDYREEWLDYLLTFVESGADPNQVIPGAHFEMEEEGDKDEREKHLLSDGWGPPSAWDPTPIDLIVYFVHCWGFPDRIHTTVARKEEVTADEQNEAEIRAREAESLMRLLKALRERGGIRHSWISCSISCTVDEPAFQDIVDRLESHLHFWESRY